jgi:transcriptional regulator with XRE-family HTH domain
MTPQECRSGRERLGWTLQRLGALADVAPRSIRRFEQGEGAARPATLAKLRAALEAAGVEFTSGGAPGVRLRRAGA